MGGASTYAHAFAFETPAPRPLARNASLPAHGGPRGRASMYRPRAIITHLNRHKPHAPGVLPPHMPARSRGTRLTRPSRSRGAVARREATHTFTATPTTDCKRSPHPGLAPLTRAPPPCARFCVDRWGGTRLPLPRAARGGRVWRAEPPPRPSQREQVPPTPACDGTASSKPQPSACAPPPTTTPSMLDRHRPCRVNAPACASLSENVFLARRGDHCAVTVRAPPGLWPSFMHPLNGRAAAVAIALPAAPPDFCHPQPCRLTTRLLWGSPLLELQRARAAASELACFVSCLWCDCPSAQTLSSGAIRQTARDMELAL